ncbi:hypothetical protein PR001_g1708 [Phytophthora rubi]|uniref:Uncharacterized protein n=1 Tax=Phytophthora rubi TaxID=129364 RepID=A0A6A3NKI3_9STRA|nr:hypothetical protein PR002_g1894 [Phytophthora rubi]KAE9051157.1 hypothetical protein PR001_g1708 [Phytophthora rubi]
MKDFPESTPPCLTDGDVKAASPENRLTIPKEIMVWRKADAAMRHVLNMTPPNSFLSCLPDDARNLEVCVIWQHLERKFENGDAGRLMAWSNRWNRILNSNWKDTMNRFSSLNQARNEMNRKSKKLIGKEMMTETMMCVQVLAQLPSEIWVSSIELTEEAFTAEKVEVALNKLFGDRSKTGSLEVAMRRQWHA